MADELLALFEHGSTDHAEVLLVVLVPAVNLPRQLAGVVALGAMPVLLRALHPLRTEGTLKVVFRGKEVAPHVLHVLVLYEFLLTVFLELFRKICLEFVNAFEFLLSECPRRPLAGVLQPSWKNFLPS